MLKSPCGMLPIILFLFLPSETLLTGVRSKSSNTFVDYEDEWKNLTVCRGNKARNLTKVSATVHKINGSYIIDVKTHYLMDTTIHEIKITVYKLAGTSKYLLWNYKITGPCRTYIFAQAIKQGLHVSDCRVKKGKYFTEVNGSRMLKTFLGTSLDYGEYLFNSMVTSKQGNIMCLSYVIGIKKIQT